MEPTPTDRLDSWKEIAALLGRDERTAMRWAKFLGMPVHHAPGGKHARVFAFRSEILAWIARSSSVPYSPERRSAPSIDLPVASGPATPSNLSGDSSRSLAAARPLWRSLFSRVWKHFMPYFPRNRQSKSESLARNSRHL